MTLTVKAGSPPCGHRTLALPSADPARKTVPPFVDGRDCQHCFLFATRADLNVAWGGDGSVFQIVGPDGTAKKARVVLPMRPAPCVHEGPIVEWCSGCPKSQQDRHVRHCLFDGHEFDRCARNHPDPKPDVRNCSACQHYAGSPVSEEVGPPPEDARPDLNPRRNLLFHLHPVAGSNWRWHAAQIRNRLDLFDGRRIVAVTTGPGLDAVGIGELPGVEVFPVPNDPALREVATFGTLFSNLTADPGEVTLYGQSKGVTHSPEQTAHRWADALWETTCDHWPHALRLLRLHPVVGPFLKEGRGWPLNQTASDWHFSGSWFWFRNADLLGKPDWRRIDRFAHGIEAYPALHFTLRQAGELFHRGPVPTMNLYNWNYWQRVVEPSLARWRIARYAEAK